MPSGGVCGVLSIMPRICTAADSAAVGTVDDLDAAALAAPAGMDLRLHHHTAPEPARNIARLLRRLRDLPPRHGHTKGPQHLLGLKLMDLHSGTREPSSPGEV